MLILDFTSEDKEILKEVINFQKIHKANYFSAEHMIEISKACA